MHLSEYPNALHTLGLAIADQRKTIELKELALEQVKAKVSKQTLNTKFKNKAAMDLALSSCFTDNEDYIHLSEDLILLRHKLRTDQSEFDKLRREFRLLEQENVVAGTTSFRDFANG